LASTAWQRFKRRARAGAGQRHGTTVARFILMNLSAFGLDNKNDAFLPTDEQIECTVGES
jgi:hypothetical protein